MRPFSRERTGFGLYMSPSITPLAGVIWATIFGLGGYLVGKNVEQLLGPIGWVALASFAVGGYSLWSFFKSHEERFLTDAERALAARDSSMHRDV
jgi:hypothetical protein